jgi:hypothetical protein
VGGTRESARSSLFTSYRSPVEAEPTEAIRSVSVGQDPSGRIHYLADYVVVPTRLARVHLEGSTVTGEGTSPGSEVQLPARRPVPVGALLVVGALEASARRAGRVAPDSAG